MNPELSIIIVHYRNPDFLKLCLDSVISTVLGIEYEVILVDSASTRESRDTAKEYDKKITNFTYLENEKNIGFSRGVNLGIKKAGGKYLLILNYDLILEPNAVSQMLDYIKNHKDIGLLGPRVLNFNETHQRTYFRFYKPLTVIVRRTFLSKLNRFKKIIDDFLMLDSDKDRIQTPDWLMGSVLMTSKKAVDKVGLMDERFFMYFEDVDWARRFWHNRYKVVYYPKPIVYHYHGRGSKSRLGLLDAIFNRKTRWHIASAFKFFLKYRNLTVSK